MIKKGQLDCLDGEITSAAGDSISWPSNPVRLHLVRLTFTPYCDRTNHFALGEKLLIKSTQQAYLQLQALQAA